MNVSSRRALLAVSLAGSNAPDIDVISQWWDTNGQYLMWHRGVTHSVYLAPVWALILTGMGRCWSREVRWNHLYLLGLAAVLIHIGLDCFNAWGTGFLEPFSPSRIAWGFIPIVDLVFWAILLSGYLWTLYQKRRLRMNKAVRPSYRTYRFVLLIMSVHLIAQTAQGLAVIHQLDAQYDKLAVSAGFVPGQFTVVAKKGNKVDIYEGNAWSALEVTQSLTTREELDLKPAFAVNPAMETMLKWSPIVIVTEEKGQLVIYDPRFLRNGESFLREMVDWPIQPTKSR